MLALGKCPTSLYLLLSISNVITEKGFCLSLTALDFGTPKDSEGLGDLFNRSIPETEMNKTLL